MTDESRDQLLHDHPSFHAAPDLTDTLSRAVELNLRGSQLLKSFRVTGNDDDLSRAVNAYEEAVRHLSEDHPKLPGFLNDVVDGYGTRFVRFGKLDDIETSITIGQKVVKMTTEDDTNFPNRLNDLAITYSRRFARLGHMDDIAEAIRLHQQVIKLTPDGHAGLPGFLDDFGISLCNRFERTEDMNDVSKAIRYQQRAVRITPDGHAELPCRLNNLGNSFSSRFEVTGDMKDNSEAIRHLRKAVRLTPEGSVDLPGRLENLGIAFWDRFEQTGNMDDISAAIQNQENAVQLTPDEHAELPGRLSNLGNSLSSRFEKTGNMQNISEAIQHLQRAVQLTLDGDADLPLRLSNLGDSLSSRFERTGAMDDISAAVQHQRRAVVLTPDGHAELPGWLQNLGVSLLRHFERTGDMDDVSESIRHLREAARLTPKGVLLPTVLNNLANSLSSRFEHTGDMEDLSEAIGHLQKAVQLTPAGRARLPAWLNGLGNAYLSRFELTGDMDDISESIRYQKRAVQLTKRRDADLPVWLNNLGNSFSCRFERTGDMDDISEAIQHHQEAVRLTPHGRAELPSRLNNLGISFRIRFERTGDSSDVSEAIRHQEEALRLTPEAHADLPSRFSNLGQSLLSRFKSTKDENDISLAIRHQQHAVQLTPDVHAKLPLWRLNLGDSFLHRFNDTRVDEHLQSAISNFHLSATSPSGSPSLRLVAAKQWVNALSQLSAPPSSDLLDAHSCIIHLLSLISGLAQTVQRRHENLLDTSQLSPAAASLAMSLNRADKAVEWLVEGRCIVWNQINQLRTPVAELRSYDTSLGMRFSILSNKLESAGLRADSRSHEGKSLSMDDKISLENETKMHIKLAKDWEELLDTIRNIPRFKDFLRPRKCADIMGSLPEEGPIIILNIHRTRCDALALIPGARVPKFIPLPKFSFQEAERLANGLDSYLRSSGVRTRLGLPFNIPEPEIIIEFPTILEALWCDVVSPILEDLAFFIPDSNAKLPRIWWCPTGPLTFLPIHAAGIYHHGKGIRGKCLSDFAVSSYIPNVPILEPPDSVKGCRDTTGLLLIGQPNTPRKAEIVFAREEVEKIEREFGRREIPHLTLIDATATVSRVLESMERFSCIHLACHASQHPETPLNSSIHLDDGPLKLSEIMKKNLQNADFSFLSACQTSMGDANLSEEVVHLASGMLAAGYRSVVGTMWSVFDEHGPDVAESFYRVMLEEATIERSPRVDGRRAARALHQATKELRGKISDSPYSFLAWVPYVHIGI